MEKNQIPLLIPATARTAQAELYKTLRDADNPAAWMCFMETVTRLLPDVLSSGRPSAESIQRSAIGQLGFKSWTEMIEAPAEHNGLAWNMSAWKAWRRAWATVQANPWLRSQPLTSSEINTVANDTKRLGKPFPGSLEDLQELQRVKVTTAEQKRTDTLAEAHRAIAEASGRVATLTEQLQLQKGTGADQAAEIGRLQGVIAGLRSEIEQLRSAASDASIPRLSRLGHLRAFLFGS